MEENIHLEFLKDDSGLVGVKLDIIDFLSIMHAGKNKETKVFSAILEDIEAINEELQEENHQQ